MHIAIHIPLPRKAIILSNSGKAIAIDTGKATVAIRISARYRPRRKGDKVDAEEIEMGDNPRRISRVVLIGRVFKGIFVIGIIEIIQTTR
jgi:hypothetical protein